MATKLNLGQPWPIFCEEQKKIVNKVLTSGKVNYWTGNQGKLFEKEFADYLSISHAIALANGTLALELALIGLDLGNDDEVIVPSRTYIATASSVFVRGAKPIVADVDQYTGNISIDTIDAVKTNKTKAIIAVHLAGKPCNMPEIMHYAKENNLLVIEDCAQAHGASYDNIKVGSFGDASAFSFCQDKIMTTGGEGGMVVFKNKDHWLKAWEFKDHGKSYREVYRSDHPSGFRWLHESFGSNFRMTEIQAALGRYQLGKLDEWVKIRQSHSKILDLYFKQCTFLRVDDVPRNEIHARYKYYVYVDKNKLKKSINRDNLIEMLNNEGIPCFSGSCSEIYLEKAFSNNNLNPPERFLNAKILGESSLVFLVDPSMNSDQMHEIGKISLSILKEAEC